jgi:hypothetical protein
MKYHPSSLPDASWFVLADAIVIQQGMDVKHPGGCPHLTDDELVQRGYPQKDQAE